MVLSVGERRVTFVDEYIENSVCPEWSYQAEFPLEQLDGNCLNLEVWDFDKNKDDDFLGRTSFHLAELEEAKVERWVKLEGVRKGEVEVRLSWCPTVSSARELTGRFALSLVVDSCTGLGPGKVSGHFRL